MNPPVPILAKISTTMRPATRPRAGGSPAHFESRQPSSAGGPQTTQENAMLYREETPKSVDQVFADIQAAAAAHGFGMLHHYDFKQTLTSKGFPLANECRVMEICNPRQASEVLSVGMALNMALPCRISIYLRNAS